MRVWLLLALAAGCARQATPTDCGPAPRLSARFVDGGVSIDGELTEAAWVETASSGAFPSLADGGQVSPHTELRALWSRDTLWLGVYAADQDLRSSDEVQLSFATPTPLKLRVSASGVVTGAPKSVHAAVDRDGTLDADEHGEDDEEWVVELEVPWAALGLRAPPTSLELSVWREDTPKGASARTVSWARGCSVPSTPRPGLVDLRAR